MPEQALTDPANAWTHIAVHAEDFDVGALIGRLHRDDARVGAVASFVGTVRDLNEGDRVAVMTLEHYPGMTERALEKIVQQARERWRLFGVVVVHRVGPLMPTDQIVFVGCASAHRGEAFDACEFIMDYLKTEAPFWKREATDQGQRWVAARATDDAARDRWHQSQ